MRYVCDHHKSKTALWVCTDCDSLYCSECVEKRIISQRGNKKTYYFCPKCNIEAERLSNNPLRNLKEIFDNFFHRTFHRPSPKKAAAHTQDDNNLLHRIDTLIKDGNIDDALVMIKNELDSISSDVNLSERYFNLLKSKDKKEEMLEQGKRYLDLLAKNGSKQKLCEVYQKCASGSSTFSASSSVTFKIAGYMIESRDLKGALNVYQGFINNNQEDPMVPKASLLAAGILNERLYETRNAAELLQGIIKRFPSHEMTPHLRQYLAQIKI